VEEWLQVQTRKDRNRIRDILAALVRSGQAKIVMDEELDMVRYALCHRSGARGAVQAKLWRFACHRFQTTRPFTAAEAAGMANCDLDYAKRYCRWLWKSAYLAIVSRGQSGAMLYQVVGGKEHENSPPWNRRAEKRKSRGQGTGARGQKEEQKPEGPQAGTPAPLEAGGALPTFILPDREMDETFPDSLYCRHCELVLGKGHRLQTGATKLDAALEDFGRALVDITGSIGRAWEIIREMKGELLAIEEQGHDEPEKPTAGHH
jgi:hypothetical protein